MGDAVLYVLLSNINSRSTYVAVGWASHAKKLQKAVLSMREMLNDLDHPKSKDATLISMELHLITEAESKGDIEFDQAFRIKSKIGYKILGILTFLKNNQNNVLSD